MTLPELITALIGLAVLVLMVIVNRAIRVQDYRREADRVTGETLARVRRIPHDGTDG